MLGMRLAVASTSKRSSLLWHSLSCQTITPWLGLRGLLLVAPAIRRCDEGGAFVEQVLESSLGYKEPFAKAYCRDPAFMNKLIGEPP